MASHPSILAWKIPRTEEPAAWWVAKESDMTYRLHNNRILITNRACLMLLPELAKTLESPLDCKEIQPVHSEGDQPWDFFGRNDAKAETPVLWPPHAKS